MNKKKVVCFHIQALRKQGRDQVYKVSAQDDLTKSELKALTRYCQNRIKELDA